MPRIFEGMDPVDREQILRPLPKSHRSKSFARRFGPASVVIVVSVSSFVSTASGQVDGPPVPVTIAAQFAADDSINPDLSFTLERSLALDRRHGHSNETLTLTRTRSELTRLMSVIDALATRDDRSAVEASAAETAKRFLRGLSDNMVLPKVAPDGDGDVLLVWDDGAPRLIVTVESARIHAAVNPGTSSSEHFDDIEFGESIPNRIAKLVPGPADPVGKIN